MTVFSLDGNILIRLMKELNLPDLSLLLKIISCWFVMVKSM